MKKFLIALLAMLLTCTPALADVLFDLPAGEYIVVPLEDREETSSSCVRIMEGGKKVAEYGMGQQFTLAAGQVVAEHNATVKRIDDKTDRLKDALSASETTTERRGLVEFCELYGMRMEKYSSEDYFITGGLGRGFSDLDTETEYYISTSGASVYIDKETFEIQRADFVLIKISEDDYAEYLNECAVVISALEFSHIDENISNIATSYNFLSDSETVWEQSVEIVNTIVNAINTGTDSFWNKFWSGQHVPVYTGNYVYFLRYLDGDNDTGYVEIIAEAN